MALWKRNNDYEWLIEGKTGIEGINWIQLEGKIAENVIDQDFAYTCAATFKKEADIIW
jgi:hypothetical protein